MNRRKLEAEAVRDCVLAVSGQARPHDGRAELPGFRDREAGALAALPVPPATTPTTRESHRRAVYRFLVRSQQQPFMTALDCADPSLAVDKRNETMTPQQALALLNNQLAVAMAKHFAARRPKFAERTEARSTAAVRLALGAASDGASESRAYAQRARTGKRLPGDLKSE